MMRPHGQNDAIPGWLIPAVFTFYLIVNIVSWQFPFFWDTLLVSTVTSWYYSNGWHGGIVPLNMDAGHPPLFQGYLLLWWKAAGRSLAFSHLAMLPILWTAVYQFIQIAGKLYSNRGLVISAAILFCLETTVLAQSTMVSPDLILLCFFLLGLRYLLEGRNLPVALAAMILCLTNIRGTVLVAALVLIEWTLYCTDRNARLRVLLKFIPAVLLFTAWVAWHDHQTGWMISTPSAQWKDHRGWPGWSGMLANTAAIIRVHLEPGRLLLAVLTATALTRYVLLPGRTNLRPQLSFVFIPLALLSISFIPWSNPIGHRYFMVVYAMLILLFVGLTQHWKFRKTAAAAVALCALSGHFWVYPPPYSNGWDSSLAHTAWFRADRGLQAQLDAMNIPADRTASRFPVDVSGDQKYLNGDTVRPLSFSAALADTASRPIFMIYSNISNDIGPEDLEFLQNNCTSVYSDRTLWVGVQLFECR